MKKITAFIVINSLGLLFAMEDPHPKHSKKQRIGKFVSKYSGFKTLRNFTQKLRDHKQHDISDSDDESNDLQSIIYYLPNELWLQILAEVFFYPEMFTDDDNLVTCLEKRNQHLANTTSRLILTCKYFKELIDDDPNYKYMKQHSLSLYKTCLNKKMMRFLTDNYYFKKDQLVRAPQKQIKLDPILYKKIRKCILNDMNDDTIADVLQDTSNLKEFYAENSSENSSASDDIMPRYFTRRTKHSFSRGLKCKLITELVATLICSNTNVNIPDKYGNTGLMYASYIGCPKLVEMLLNSSAEINAQDKKGRTALYLICKKILTRKKHSIFSAKLPATFFEDDSGTHEDSFKPISIEDCNILIEDYSKPTLLNQIIYGSRQSIEALIDDGADVNIQDPRGNTPLMLACNNRCIGITKLLLAYGADVNIQNHVGDTPLILACDDRRIGIAKLLLAHGADVNIQNRDRKTALHFAVKNQHTSMIALLKENGAKKINVKKYRVKKPKFDEILNMLLKKGADPYCPNNKGNNPFSLALMIDNIAFIDKLLEFDQNYTGLHDGKELTLIHAVGRPKKLVKILLAKKVNTNFTIKFNNCTALIHATNGGQIAISRILLKAGAYVNTQTINGFSPLILAVNRDSEELVELLLQADADPNMQEEKGNTALIYAVKAESVEIVKMLLQNGADFNIKNKKGKSAMSIAKNKDNNEILNLMNA